MAVPALTANSPVTGSIAWAAFSIRYAGNSYAVSAGSTAQPYVWWRFAGGSPVIEAGPDVPATLGPDDLVLFGNKNGTPINLQSATLIDGGLLVDGSILTDALAANSVTALQILAGSVNASKIAADTITANQIASGAITADELAANSVNADKIAANAVTAVKIAAGAITADKIQAGAITVGTVNGLQPALDAKTTPEYVQSRGTDLIANGTGILGTNYNFSQFTLDKTDAPTGATGSFDTPRSAGTYLVSETLPVDPGKKLQFSYQIKQKGTSTTARFYGLLQPLDSSKAQISPQYYMFIANTLTTLAAPLNPGDTKVTLTSAANWDNSATASRHYFTFWDYVDAGGKAWPTETYSRNSYYGNWVAGAVAGNVVTLPAAYTGPAKAAGTPVSNGMSGGTYMYSEANLIAPSVWTPYATSIVGLAPPGASASFAAGWPAGTAYAKLGWLANRDSAGATDPNSLMSFALVSFSDAQAAQATATAASTAAATAASAAATANTAAGAANSAATAAAAAASTANTQINAWKYTGTTQIDGGDIHADTITAVQIAVGAISADALGVGSVTADAIEAGAIVADKIAAGAVTADAIDANAITADKIASVDLIGDRAVLGTLNVGSNITVDPNSGITVNQSDGQVTHLAADGSGNQFAGQATLDGATILGNLSIYGATNNLSGEIDLAVGVTDPKLAPTIGAGDWAYTIVQTPPAYNYVTGLAYDGGSNWLTCMVDQSPTTNPSKIVQFADSTPSIYATKLTLPTLVYPLGVTKIGTSYYVLVQDSNSPPSACYVYVYNSSWVKTGQWSAAVNLNGGEYATIGTNGTSILIARTNSLNVTYVDVYTLTGTRSSSVNCGTWWDTNNMSASGIVGTAVGFAAARFVIASAGGGIRVFSTTGARQTTEEWTAANGGKNLWGLAHDGTAWSSLYVSSALVFLFHYTNLSGSYDFGYTWYDNNASGTGTAETKVSPLRTITPTRYARWPYALPSGPPYDGTVDGANTARLYAAPHGSPLVLQSELTPPALSGWFTSLITSGTAPPAVSGFANRAGASPGRISSATHDVAGNPLIDLRGDGSGRVGPVQWDVVGARVPLDTWHKVTYQNGWSDYDASLYFGAEYTLRDGKVILRGMVSAGTINSAIFTLPVGYQPARAQLFSILAQQEQTGAQTAGTAHTHPITVGATCRFGIATNGVVTPSAMNTAAWISLYGIEFYLD